MSQLHFYDLLLVIGCIFLFLIIVWGLEKFLPSNEDLAGAHDFVDDEHVAQIALHHYSPEIVDPYLRIESLENECHGYLIQIEQLKNALYSYRHIPAAILQNGGSDLRVEGPDHSHSQIVDDSQDCA